MSIRVMSQVWDRGPLAHIDRYVLLAIADNANDEGYAHPSIKTISAKTRLSTRTVMRSIQSLEDGGWLISHRKSRDVKFSTYDIVLERFTKSGDSQSRDTQSPEKKSGDSRDKSQVTPSPKSGDSQSRFPHTPYIEEPPINHQYQPPRKTGCELYGEQCFKAYPKQTSPKAGEAAFSGLIKELRSGRFLTIAAAGNWLLGRVREYAASPCVTTKSLRFVPKATAWVSEGRYDESPDLWMIAAPPPPVTGDFLSERAQLARII